MKLQEKLERLTVTAFERHLLRRWLETAPEPETAPPEHPEDETEDPEPPAATGTLGA